ncbi:MAG: hypothetical protein J5849_07105 [Clostridia bacterium]|nr:hypothetical protein [Clostridia bacterium]
MKSRAFSLLLILLLLPFPSCAGKAHAEAEALRDGALSRFPLTAEAALTASLGEGVSQYRFSFTASEDAVTLTVLEPEPLAGLQATAEGPDLALSYGGILFAPEKTEGVEESPLFILPCAYEALRTGILTESVRSGSTLFAAFTRYRGEDATSYRFAFDRKSGRIDSLSVFHEGREIASAVFSPSL